MKIWCFKVKVHGVEGEKDILVNENEADNVCDAEDQIVTKLDEMGYKASFISVKVLNTINLEVKKIEGYQLTKDYDGWQVWNYGRFLGRIYKHIAKDGFFTGYYLVDGHKDAAFTSREKAVEFLDS